MSFFPAEIVTAAQAAYAKYFPKGPYASVTLAQWAIESAYGAHMPLGSNNPFGIKAVPGQQYVAAKTKEFLNGQMVEVVQNFAKYDTVEEAFEAHAKLLATSHLYAKAQAAGSVEGYVRSMAPVYATAPNYASVILGLIAKANLTQYDLPNTAKPPSAPPAPPAPPQTGDNSKGKFDMGNFFTILMALAQDIPQAITVIQNLANNPLAQELESLLGLHFSITTTPGQSAIIEPNSSIPKSGGVGATVTTNAPLNPSGAIGG